MSGLFDSLSGTIFSRSGDADESDVAIINSLENAPPVRVRPQDIYVRKCRLTGDGINCHFGRFHTDDLPVLLQKGQGVSCLIGHRKDTAGIARFFGGSIERHPARDVDTGDTVDMDFIVPKVYWLKAHSQAEDLRVNIDGGVYHQASISWFYEKPVCGLCGHDIRECDHVPGRRYDGALCFFWYEGIGDVLEGSIVYAGGHPGTGFELSDERWDASPQASVFKIGPDRIDREAILPYLKNAEEGDIKLAGDIAGNGWTDGDIAIAAESIGRTAVGELVPPYLAERLSLQHSGENGNCIIMDQVETSETDADVNNELYDEEPEISVSGDTEQGDTSIEHISDVSDNGGDVPLTCAGPDRLAVISGGNGTALCFSHTASGDVFRCIAEISKMPALPPGTLFPVTLHGGLKDDAESDGAQYGRCLALEWGAHRRRAAVAGGPLHGLLELRKIKAGAETRWFLRRMRIV